VAFASNWCIRLLSTISHSFLLFKSLGFKILKPSSSILQHFIKNLKLQLDRSHKHIYKHALLKSKKLGNESLCQRERDREKVKQISCSPWRLELIDLEPFISWLHVTVKAKIIPRDLINCKLIFTSTFGSPSQESRSEDYTCVINYEYNTFKMFKFIDCA